MAMNEQDWINCIKSRQKPFCEVEEGHRVSVACLLANMSLRLRGVDVAATLEGL